MNDNGYSITLIVFDELGNPSILTYVDMLMCTNETPLGVSKIFNIQKGEPFSTGGRYNYNKLTIHTIETNLGLKRKHIHHTNTMV